MATYYVDFSATYDGDGSAYTQAASGGTAGAFNTLVGHLGSSGDTFWIRRATKAASSSAINFNVDNVKYIGWPLSGDDYYSTRPSGAQASWDPDAATYATLAYNSSATAYTASGGTAQQFYRLKFTASSTGTTTSLTVNCTYKSCYFEYTGSSANAGATFNNGKFYSCIAHSSAVSGQSWYVSNTSGSIYMYSCTTDTGSSNNDGLLLNWVSGTVTINILAINCTFKGNGNGHGLDMPGGGNNQGVVQFYGCNFYGGSGTGANSKGMYIVAGSYNVKFLTFTQCAIVAGTGLYVSFGYATGGGNSEIPWHFTQLTQTAASSTYGIYISSGGCPIYVENFTAYSGNTSGDILADSPVYIRNCTFVSPTEVGASDTYAIKSVYLLDYAGTKGAWKHYCGASCINTAVTTTRTGGEAFSIQMTPSAAPTITDGIIAWIGTPGKETIFASVAAGARTVTIYGAYKGWTTTPTQADIWFEGAYYAGASGAAVTNFSTRAIASRAALTSDASTWSDGTLTGFSMAITFTAGQASIVPIRIFLTRYDSGAYIVIDPKPVVA